MKLTGLGTSVAMETREREVSEVTPHFFYHSPRVGGGDHKFALQHDFEVPLNSLNGDRC